MGKTIQIIHRPTGTLIAEGPSGWGIASFDGAYYVSRKYLKTDGFSPNFIPGLCFYKFLYTWMNFKPGDGSTSKNLGWMYWLPNPLFPFIWYRVAIPRYHPEIEVRSL